MSLNYISHEKIDLKKHPEFNEVWLHDRICENPQMLWLGDVAVLDRERNISSGGRIDLILYDEENSIRYETEIMLGATDPSHIIRCIEYWDLERKRYPGYDHVAVLIAENITTRFLNVLSLFAGSIPLIAIQLNALQVNDYIVLDFIKTVDQTALRIDDAVETSVNDQVDRKYWENKAGDILPLCDKFVELINQISPAKQELSYRQSYMGLSSNGVVKNYVTFTPKIKSGFIIVRFKTSANNDELAKNFECLGIDVLPRKNRFRIRLNEQDFEKGKVLLQEAIQLVFDEA